ncbi:unnamed protein product [Rotaria sp. Silwood1]|nr:unnamed protein product [Rotaria sp. Silwood1]
MDRSGKKLQQIHVEVPLKGSYFVEIFPYTINVDDVNIRTVEKVREDSILRVYKGAHTNLSFSPFLQAEKLNIKVHIHYPRLWNSLQEWFINIDTTKAQVYFVFEHKNFLQDLLYVQYVKSLDNRQTFHLNKLRYDIFNIEIDISSVNLLLHRLFLKKNFGGLK